MFLKACRLAGHSISNEVKQILFHLVTYSNSSVQRVKGENTCATFAVCFKKLAARKCQLY